MSKQKWSKYVHPPMQHKYQHQLNICASIHFAPYEAKILILFYLTASFSLRLFIFSFDCLHVCFDIPYDGRCEIQKLQKMRPTPGQNFHHYIQYWQYGEAT